MTFEEFMADVEADLKMGGVTWGQAYMRALNRKLPELVDQVKDDPHRNPATNLANLAEFLFLVRTYLAQAGRREEDHLARVRGHGPRGQLNNN